ncbi:MAG: PDZ domain-containing protein [Steroidobacteraceae bacterium]
MNRHLRCLPRLPPALLAAALFALPAAPAGAQSTTPKPKQPPADVEARLEAARARLEAAAREVAELSADASATVIDRVIVYGGGPRRAIIGVQVDPASGREGARIAMVSPGGPAAEAGLKSGDVIVALGGTEFAGKDDPARLLVERMREAAPEEKLKAQVLREGKRQDFVITTRRAPQPTFNAPLAPMAPAAPLSPDAPDAPGMPRGAFTMAFPDWGQGGIEGLELATLSPQLGRYFGAERGVLVLRAPETGPWKLQDGDVIQSIDGRVPSSGAHATRILRSYQAGEKLRMRVLRERKTLELEVEAPATEELFRRRTRVIHAQEAPPAS